MTKRLALAFTTRDRTELSERSIEPLLHDDIDLWIMDGSRTEKGRMFAETRGNLFGTPPHLRANVMGGADAAIVYALTTLLNETDAPYVGVCENDVLLHEGWFGPCLALFERAVGDGLSAGVVSARAYADRILVQRDGYALMHNTGAGHLILTRQAARLTLNHYRSHWTTANARVFQALSGLDIRRHWAFRGHKHMITVDWGIDTILAAHGLASLALTPSDVEMIGQATPLADQGLCIAKEPVELLRNDDAFERFADMTCRIREGFLRLPDQTFCRTDDGAEIIFPHQLGAIDGTHDTVGKWYFRWQQGFGPFAYVASDSCVLHPVVEIPVTGPCEIMVGGGPTGGRATVTDTQSGYEMEVDLPAEGKEQQIRNLHVPGTIHYRVIRLTALTPGTTFYGVTTHEPHLRDPTWTFDHSSLPKPA